MTHGLRSQGMPIYMRDDLFQLVVLGCSVQVFLALCAYTEYRVATVSDGWWWTSSCTQTGGRVQDKKTPGKRQPNIIHSNLLPRASFQNILKLYHQLETKDLINNLLEKISRSDFTRPCISTGWKLYRELVPPLVLAFAHPIFMTVDMVSFLFCV